MRIKSDSSDNDNYITNNNVIIAHERKMNQKGIADFDGMVIEKITRNSRINQNDNVCEELYFFEYKLSLDVTFDDVYNLKNESWKETTVTANSYPLSISVHKNQVYSELIIIICDVIGPMTHRR